MPRGLAEVPEQAPRRPPEEHQSNLSELLEAFWQCRRDLSELVEQADADAEHE